MLCKSFRQIAPVDLAVEKSKNVGRKKKNKNNNNNNNNNTKKKL
jgi:hypothetical protein